MDRQQLYKILRFPKKKRKKETYCQISCLIIFKKKIIFSTYSITKSDESLSKTLHSYQIDALYSPKQIGLNRKRTSITHSISQQYTKYNITSAAIRDPCSTRHTEGHEGRLNTGPRSLHGLLRWSRNKRRLTGAAKVQYTGNPRSRIERWPSESARWHSMHTRVVREKDFDVIVSSLQPPWKTVKIIQPVYNSTYSGRPSWLFVGKLWNCERATRMEWLIW